MRRKFLQAEYDLLHAARGGDLPASWVWQDGGPSQWLGIRTNKKKSKWINVLKEDITFDLDWRIGHGNPESNPDGNCAHMWPNFEVLSSGCNLQLGVICRMEGSQFC